MRTNKKTNRLIDKARVVMAALLLVGIGALAVVGCGNKAGNNGGGNADMAQTCFMNPTTHVQIINACTTAQAIDITPFYPSSAPGGTLPSLP